MFPSMTEADAERVIGAVRLTGRALAA